MMHESWNKAGGKINIEVNALGQPIMPETSILASHLGVLARDGSLLPLHYTDWRHVPKHYKKRVWNEIKVKCNNGANLRKKNNHFVAINFNINCIYICVFDIVGLIFMKSYF